MSNRARQLDQVYRFEDLTDPTSGPRLTNALRVAIDDINAERVTLLLPKPAALAVIATGDGLLIRWSDLPLKFWRSVHGAEIWRAFAADDPSLNFFENNRKTVIVSALSGTAYNDSDNTSGQVCIYWVRWIDLDGHRSDVAGGVQGTAP